MRGFGERSGDYKITYRLHMLRFKGQAAEKLFSNVHLTALVSWPPLRKLWNTISIVRFLSFRSETR